MEKPDLGGMGNFNFDMIEMLCSHLQVILQNPKHFFWGYFVYLEY